MCANLPSVQKKELESSNGLHPRQETPAEKQQTCTSQQQSHPDKKRVPRKQKKSNVKSTSSKMPEEPITSVSLIPSAREAAELFEWRWNTSSYKRVDVDIQNFEYLQTIGVGASSTVGLVRHRETNTQHALKILQKARLICREKRILDAVQERDILAAVEHPFIIQLEASFQNNINLFILMEFAPGGDIFEMLQRVDGVLPEKQVCFYGSQVVLALEYLHNVHIVYRDLKPENLLIDSAGYVKLVDMGLAVMIRRPCHEQEYVVKSRCGTSAYMAPEILEGKEYSYPVDWWAFGCLMYEMAADRPPFGGEGESREVVYRRILDVEYSLPMHFSGKLIHLVKNLLEPDVNFRYGATVIRSHSLFEAIGWEAVYTRQAQAPFIPDPDIKYFPENLGPPPELDRMDNPDKSDGGICLFDKF